MISQSKHKNKKNNVSSLQYTQKQNTIGQQCNPQKTSDEINHYIFLMTYAVKPHETLNGQGGYWAKSKSADIWTVTCQIIPYLLFGGTEVMFSDDPTYKATK